MAKKPPTKTPAKTKKSPVKKKAPKKASAKKKRATTGTVKSNPARRLFVRLLKFVSALGLGLTLLGAVVAMAGYQYFVVHHPGAHLDPENIRGLINQESPVFYRDGQTRVGVFFEESHRDFVPWAELPPGYVMAIVAAEDGRFWYHRGVSPKHIARAMFSNLIAGGVVAGGSTLTQQTAKNLFKRPDRTLRSKLVELVNALRLEEHYSKQEILTFYANQFHVSGNGRGLGIAARYFFDKEVEQLSLLESAFLAGLVKAPSHYDPYLGDKERRKRAVSRARDRTGYVLRRLAAERPENLAASLPGFVQGSDEERIAAVKEVQAQAQKLSDEGFEIEFHRGVFRYDSSVVLDEVSRRLAQAPFPQVLEKAGITDPDGAGLEVITTLDPAAQREAIYGLWHHLTEVGVMLEGRTASDFVLTDGRGPRFQPERVLIPHTFHRARVAEHLSKGASHLKVDLGGHECLLDRGAMVRAAVAVYRGQKKSKTAKAPTSVVNQFVAGLKDEAMVWVSVREVPESGPNLCDLELRPDVQGSIVALQDGEIRAMVGGNDNRNFNRATALRQLGSTWKPLVFHAALRLGWSPTDELDNSRQVFPFSSTYYFPRPDHDPLPVVSMAWAGVRSENLASIWLLYHLTDRLNLAQLRSLVASVGLARGEEEPLKAYRTRIQKEGVLPTPGRMTEVFFNQSKQETGTGLAFDGHPEDGLNLMSLHYGWGFSEESRRVQLEEPRARTRKLRALEHSWKHLEPLLSKCELQYKLVKRALKRGNAPYSELLTELSFWQNEGGLEVACGVPPQGYVPLSQVAEEGRGLPLERFDDALVDDRLHGSTLRSLRSGIKRRKLARKAAGSNAPGLYEPDVLYWHQDFRVLLNMKIVVALARHYGVYTDIREVLSLPLGASEITLEEAASLYSGLTTGTSWSFPGEAYDAQSDAMTGELDLPPSPTLLIAEIRDVDGRVIYKAKGASQEVTSSGVGEMTSDILRNTVLWGTGKRARQAIDAAGAALPVGGKTGTTNAFRNAAFLGFVPVASGGSYRVSGGYSLGVYVGYDDNRPLTSGNIKFAGSSGALPAWISAARGLQTGGLLGEPKGKAGDGWAIERSFSLIRMPVDASTGLPSGHRSLVFRPGADETSVLAPRGALFKQLGAAGQELSHPPRFSRKAAPVGEGLRQAREHRKKRKKEAKRRRSIWSRP